MDMKRFFLYAIVIAALAVAGCGGNGGGGTTTPPVVDDDPPINDVDLSMLLTGYTTVPAGTYKIDAGDSRDVGHATFACPAGGMDCSVTVAADGTAKSTGGAATASASQSARDAKADADAAAAMAMAEAFLPAIAKARANGDLGVFDANGNGSIDAGEINEALDRGAPAGTLTVDGDKVSHDDNKKFTKSTDTPVALRGFSGSVHTRKDRETATATTPVVTDTVTIYTDKMAPTPTAFDTVFTSVANGQLDVSGNQVTTLGPIGKTAVGATDEAKGLSLYKFEEHVPSSGTATITFGTAANTSDSDNPKSISGKFDGASGTYTCTGTCVVTMNNKGGITATANISGTVNFVPAENASIPAPDTDYLTLGYWVQETTDSKNMTKYAATTVATGKLPYGGSGTGAARSALNNFATFAAAQNTVSQQATYKGPATGLFVHNTDIDGDGKGPIPTSSGQFTADAELTATFGNPGTVGSDFHNGIRGTVKNFMNSSTRTMIEGWSLTLNTAFPVANGSNVMTGTTSGGSGLPDGGWRGQFYGPATTDATDLDNDNNPDPIAPGAVAGEFLGHFSNGHVNGVFGAKR